MSLFAPFRNQKEVEMYVATNFLTESERSAAYTLIMRFQETMINGYAEESPEESLQTPEATHSVH